MKKNNAGFFLIETIVVLTIVTTVMAFVFPNVSSLYSNFKKQSKLYDQTEDLITLRSIYEYNKEYIEKYTKGGPNNDIGCKRYGDDSTATGKLDNTNFVDSIYMDNIKKADSDLSDLYITGYTINLSSNDREFSDYLNKMKKNVYNPNIYEYRLIGIFESSGNKRYASIKIGDPNPNAGCE